MTAGGQDLAELLDIAREAARIAGDVIMPIYRSSFEVETKADLTPVTIADRNAELAIREFLARECAGHGILGEEFGETEGDGRHRWILDPIDGTKPFTRRVPLFGTLIALERDGVPVVGVISCHAAGETAYAALGLGAFVDEVPAHVSDRASLGRDALICTTSTRSLYDPIATAGPSGIASGGAMTAILRTGTALQTWGDCFGYVMVATGRAEAMLDPQMNLWDVAALYPIITEAGGRLTTWAGEDGVGDSTIASNGHVHEEILALLRE